MTARESGVDLEHVTFVGAGEPPTPAKLRAIARAGARYAPTYVSTEVGHLGFGCANPASGNDVHFFAHRYALTTRTRLVELAGVSVDAFLITALHGNEPSVALNLENGDHGIVEERPCGCGLEQAGFTMHVRDVASVAKMTGEGVTLLGSDLLRVLEEELPSRFGGTAFDYQLVEEDDVTGSTLSLVVSPRVSIPNEASVVETFVRALTATRLAADQQTRGQSGRQRQLLDADDRLSMVSVRREEPVLTARGKWVPIVRRPGPAPN